MARIDQSKFILNSDFPMPAQVSNASTSITIPAGTSKIVIFQQTLDIDPKTEDLRVSVKSSRNNILVPGILDLFEPDVEFIAWAEKYSSNKVRCVIIMANWEGGQQQTTSTDNTFTFYISGFKLP